MRDKPGRSGASRSQIHTATFSLVMPINFPGHGPIPYFGSFRFANCGQFNQYVSGKFYDPTFYAPKDQILQAYMEPCLDSPWEFCPDLDQEVWSSYVLSPAGMFGTDILSENRQTG